MGVPGVPFLAMTVYIQRRNVKRNPRDAGGVAHWHDHEGRCLTRAEARELVDEVDKIFPIEPLWQRPYECRARLAHQARLAARLQDLHELSQRIVVTSPEEKHTEIGVDLPDPAPPPMVCARSTTAPPNPPAAFCRVEVLIA